MASQFQSIGQVRAKVNEAAAGAVIGSWSGGASVGTNGVCVFQEVPPGQYRVSTKPFVPGQVQSRPQCATITVQARKTTDVQVAR